MVRNNLSLPIRIWALDLASFGSGMQLVFYRKVISHPTLSYAGLAIDKMRGLTHSQNIKSQDF